MIVSYNWLKTLIDFDMNPEDLSALLTDTGLEVEKVRKIESIQGGLAGLVVGEVLTCEKAKNSDKLSVTTVNVGEESPLPIICGAPNVAQGQKVVIAKVGSTIYPTEGEPFKIKKAKIRGHVSEGMICAEDEIGLGQSHDGIMVLDSVLTPGTPLADVFDLDEDYQIEIGLTPNRGDAASHLGTARDIQAMKQGKVELPEIAPLPNLNKAGIAVEVKDASRCPRYAGILLKNIEVKESPDWLQKRLRSIDLNPINNVVDTTNYVLHELGQPIHAFDADKIDEKIIVRDAVKGEKITTLDDVERTMSGEELLICDANRPLALAGVFGGANSGVTASTTSVFIESAYFNPAVVRKSAKTHGLNTDASFRYERGCDPNITMYALQRVVHILQEVAGAEIASNHSDFYPNPVANNEIDLDVNWLNRFCGTQLSTDEVADIFGRLEIEVVEKNNEHIKVSVAPYRSDVLRPVDLAEEVLRIYGYNQVEIPKRINMTPAIQPNFDDVAFKNKVANYLVGKGFYESMSNSQTRQTERTKDNFVGLLNPLSVEHAIMRTDMIDGILSSVAYNINRKNSNVLFFEFGKTYFKNDNGYGEQNNLMLVATGSSNRVNWTTQKMDADYFYLKGALEGLAQVAGIPAKKLFKAVEIDSFDKKTLKSFGVKQPVYYALVNWDAVLNHGKNARFNLQDIPVFPIVSRDLSIVLSQKTGFNEVERIVKEVAGNFLKGLDIFDVYEGKHLEEGKKSYAISIKLYDAKQTMTDQKIEKIMDKMMARLENELHAVIRK